MFLDHLSLSEHQYNFQRLLDNLFLSILFWENPWLPSSWLAKTYSDIRPMAGEIVQQAGNFFCMQLDQFEYLAPHIVTWALPEVNTLSTARCDPQIKWTNSDIRPSRLKRIQSIFRSGPCQALTPPHLSGWTSDCSLTRIIRSLYFGPMTDPVENTKEMFATFSRSWLNLASRLTWWYCWKVAGSLGGKNNI